MIGSFWNLCRACPSMPVDKLHSEYRSTYRWHEYTGTRHEVVRRPPQGAQAGTAATAVPAQSNAATLEETVETPAVHSNCEPAMSRKKKHPQLAYRTHEFLPMTDSGAPEEPADSAVKVDRARTNPIASVISRISTEYQLQFAWPRGDQGKNKTDSYQDSTPPRKSVSMGAIRPIGNPNLASVHKKRVPHGDQGEDGVSELEPLVAHDTEDGQASFEFDDSQGEEKIQEEMSSKEEKPRRRSISKEEKDKENSKKTSPTTPASVRQPTARHPAVVNMLHDTDKKVAPVSVPVGLPMEKSEDMKSDIFRSRKDFLIRHHLQRTTGAEDGALLTSPTREKLEPVMPRPKEDETPRSPKRASPKGSPSSKNRSPKRQSRLSSSAPSAAIHHSSAAQQNGGVHVERRPRPTSLATNAPPCVKSSSDPAPLSQHSYTKPTSSRAKLANGVHEDQSSGNKQDAIEDAAEKEEQDSAAKLEDEKEEPIVVKSPPEPTRVKSPEQIIMRSPEPVNWTVPLDTGKTFTVTQNIHDGEMITRPHSEVKAWTPPAARPPAPQSAPPELSRQQHRERASVESRASSPTDAADCGFQSPNHGDSMRPGGSSLPLTGSHEDDSTPLQAPVTNEPGCESLVEGTTLRCLDAPDDPTLLYEVLPKCADSSGQALYRVLEAQPAPVSPETALSRTMPIVSPSTSRSLASDVLEKARNRFDKFWGKGKDSGEKQGKV